MSQADYKNCLPNRKVEISRLVAYHGVIPEAFVGLVTAPVFKTGEILEMGSGGFDSHPFPLGCKTNDGLL